MGASATAVRIRHDLHARMLDARAQSDALFGIVDNEAIYDRPIPERHRIIFYLGHVEAFDWNLLAQRAFGLQTKQRTFDDLFAFGIDPVGGRLPSDKPSDWPKREEVEHYNRRLRNALEVAIEHRLMHAETLAYMLHRLPTERKIRGPIAPTSGTTRSKSRLVEIPAGRVTLGLKHVTGDEFGWDNELEAQEADVAEFAIESGNVTNRNFLGFIQAGGYDDAGLWSAEAWAWKEKVGAQHPAFWRRDGNLWMYRTMFGEVRLPLDWPVYVSHAEATAYAKWLGRALPSEAQFHRAAYGTYEGQDERSYPWGEDAPGARHGNFNFKQWDPAPTGSYPDGASSFGIQDLVGNGWEWTRTPFAPFHGFVAMPYYPGYSANFFDGKHYVMKGGSPRTAACMLRRSFRNWFQPHYPYVYATFRCVED